MIVLLRKLNIEASKLVEISSTNENHMTNMLNSSVCQVGNLSIKAKSSNVNFRKEKTNINSLGTFIELVEKHLFKPSNHNKIKRSVTTEKRKPLKTIQNGKLRSYRLQDKLLHFVILYYEGYIEKIDYQSGRSF